MTTPPNNKILHFKQTTTSAYFHQHKELHINVYDNGNNKVDVQSIQTINDKETKERFRITTNPNAKRPHELWLKLESHQDFNFIKYKTLTWFRDQNYWIQLHPHGYKVVRTSQLGHILSLDAGNIYRQDYQSIINNDIIPKQLKNLTNTE